MANWILKFISGKYQGGEFPLDEGVVYTVGRANDSDMVLVEDMVSRNHATLTVQNDTPILEDLGSTNGSFVNGDRVRRVELKEGDRILFGTSIIRLVRATDATHALAGMTPMEALRASAEASNPVGGRLPEPPAPAAGRTMAMGAIPAPPAPIGLTMPPGAAGGAALAAAAAPAPAAPPAQLAPPPLAPIPTDPGQNRPVAQAQNPTMVGKGLMSGVLEEISLPDLLQLFSTGRKSGLLRVAQGDLRAQLHLREGRVAFALIEGQDLHPEKAAYRIMTWTHGTFVLELPEDRDFPVTLDMSTEALMMEAMRLSDELGTLRNAPPLDARLELALPLAPPLRSLSPELLDTLQAVLNHRVVGDILDHTLATDLETMQDIIYLLANRYLRQA
jgi:hypothetical protein